MFLSRPLVLEDRDFLRLTTQRAGRRHGLKMVVPLEIPKRLRLNAVVRVRGKRKRYVVEHGVKYELLTSVTQLRFEGPRSRAKSVYCSLDRGILVFPRGSANDWKWRHTEFIA